MLEMLIVPAAYLFGSISSAILICKCMGLPDPRTSGSNNPGATNVLRLGGKRPAFFTLVCDMLKGFIPVYCAVLLELSDGVLAATALAAFLGHLFPLFFGFKGGKGVATGLGAQFGLSWMVGGTVALLWLFFARVLKISSLSALLSMGLAPVIVWVYLPAPELVAMQVVMTLLLFWRHRSNIRKLIAGTEGQILSSPGAESPEESADRAGG